MPTIEHSTLSTTDLHEPKGVSSAVAGAVYHADGAGSGTWERVQGWGQYQDTNRTVGTPTQTIATGVRTQFICDGGFLTTEKLPSDASASLWNTSTNKHIPIAEYDTYQLRLSFTAENYAGTSPYIEVELDIGGTPGVILDESRPLLKSGNAQKFTLPWDVFVGGAYMSNGGTIYLTYNGTGSCDIYANSIKIERISKDYT